MLRTEKALQSPAIGRILIVGKNSEVPRAAFTLADAKALRPVWSVPVHILYAVATFSLFFFGMIQWGNT